MKNDIRLFFAIWPNDNVRAEISQNLRLLDFEQSRIRAVPSHNWHMTLHFIGNTSFAEKACLHKQAQKINANTFNLSIDIFGYFKKPKVLWLGCQQVPQALIDLQKVLGDQLSHCNYQPETRPYSPHVTVARKVLKQPPPMPVKLIEWSVDRFVLVESVSVKSGVEYHVIEEYRFH